MSQPPESTEPADPSTTDEFESALAPRIVPSTARWVDAALSDLSTLLVDHAHCERKAAQTALQFVQQRPTDPALCAALSRLAREELVHFERVLGEMKARGIAMRSLPSAGYAGRLFELVRKDHRDLDAFLICALIEARSHERFVRLAQSTSDARLSAFYTDLGTAEERHGAFYVGLAQSAASDEEKRLLSRRLDELTAAEAEIVHRPNQPIRMHAGG